jgi:hypothetical protein
MMDWTKDERTAALMVEAVAHANEFDEFSLKHEAQLELIREEYLTDLWCEFRSEDDDAFEEWHGQLTVAEAFDVEFNA